MFFQRLRRFINGIFEAKTLKKRFSITRYSFSPVDSQSRLPQSPDSQLPLLASFICLGETPIDEDSVLLRPQAGKEELAPFLDRYVVFFVYAHR